MSAEYDVHPRFSSRAKAEDLQQPSDLSDAQLVQLPELKLHERPQRLLDSAIKQGCLGQVVEAIAVLQVSDRLFSASVPAWRHHHHAGLESDLSAYSEVIRQAQAGWKSDWVKNNGLNPTLYREVQALIAQISQKYGVDPSNRADPGNSLNNLFVVPFSEYHFKFAKFEVTSGGKSRAVYQSTRVQHEPDKVKFTPCSQSIFSGDVKSEHPPKFLCGVPKKMQNPPQGDCEYFELHYCTAVDQNNQVRSTSSARGLSALEALRSQLSD